VLHLSILLECVDRVLQLSLLLAKLIHFRNNLLLHLIKFLLVSLMGILGALDDCSGKVVNLISNIFESQLKFLGTPCLDAL
jgi:hypothetical protein